MTAPIRYVVLTLDDAHMLAAALSRTGAHRGALSEERDDPRFKHKIPAEASEKLATIYDRLTLERGADMQEIVDILKALPVCSECLHRGCARFCNVLDAQKQGRRLRRLLERARGERQPGGAEDKDGAA